MCFKQLIFASRTNIDFLPENPPAFHEGFLQKKRNTEATLDKLA